MAREWHLLEMCAGSAALTMSLCGSRTNLLPYQGNKWRFRRVLQELLRRNGFERQRLCSVHLNDLGPWGRTWSVLMFPDQCEQVLSYLDKLSIRDPREAYDHLNGSAVPDGPVAYAAQFLFLQRLSVNGKAVVTRDGCWCSPGFNATSAYGKQETDRFGQISPMLPCLLERVEVLCSMEWPERRRASQLDARELNLSVPGELCSVVYIDPDYVGTTGYRGVSLSRSAVVHVARKMSRTASFVMVSEGQPIPELEDEGWQVTQISPGRPDDASPFKSKSAEYVTWFRR